MRFLLIPHVKSRLSSPSQPPQTNAPIPALWYVRVQKQPLSLSHAPARRTPRLRPIRPAQKPMRKLARQPIQKLTQKQKLTRALLVLLMLRQQAPHSCVLLQRNTHAYILWKCSVLMMTSNILKVLVLKLMKMPFVTCANTHLAEAPSAWDLRLTLWATELALI